METKNFPKKLALAWLAVLTLTTALAACGNKGGSNNSAPPVVTPTCANCSGITPATLVTATSSTPFSASWIFNGDTNTMSSIRNSNPYADLYAVYNGSLTVTGSFSVPAPISFGTCTLPAGTYTLSTISLGTAYYGTYSLQQMSATNGSITINFSISNGVFYTMGSSNVLASGNMNISTVNGAACYGQIYFN